jgi:hypothetical protein
MREQSCRSPGPAPIHPPLTSLRRASSCTWRSYARLIYHSFLRYYAVSIPSAPVTYSFKPETTDRTLIAPTADVADTRPLFVLTIAADVFMPQLVTTMLSRGPAGHGAYVGEFEYASRHIVPTVADALIGPVCHGATLRLPSAPFENRSTAC